MSSVCYAKRRRSKTADKFFLINDLFHLTAKQWAELLNDLDSLTVEERERVVWGRDDEYGRYE